MLKRNISWGKPPFHAPIEPGPEQHVTHLSTVAGALQNVIDVAGDGADLDAGCAKIGSTPELPSLASYFKLKLGTTGEVFTVTITRGWQG